MPHSDSLAIAIAIAIAVAGNDLAQDSQAMNVSVAAASGLGIAGAAVELAMARDTVNQAPVADRDFVAGVEYDVVVTGVIVAVVKVSMLEPEILRPLECVVSPQNSVGAILMSGIFSGSWRVSANLIHENVTKVDQRNGDYRNGPSY